MSAETAGQVGRAGVPGCVAGLIAISCAGVGGLGGVGGIVCGQGVGGASVFVVDGTGVVAGAQTAERWAEVGGGDGTGGRGGKVESWIVRKVEWKGQSGPSWWWFTGRPDGRVWARAGDEGRAKGKEGGDAAVVVSVIRGIGAGASSVQVGVGGGRVRQVIRVDDAARGKDVLDRVSKMLVKGVAENERAGLAERLLPAVHDPVEHWRAGVLVRALGVVDIGMSKGSALGLPSGALGGALGGGAGGVDEVARFRGNVMAGAIGRVARSNARLGELLAERLLLIARLPSGDVTQETDGGGGGVWTAMWAGSGDSGSGIGGAELLGGAFEPWVVSVLEPGASDVQIARRVESWLSGEPSTLFWTIDDAGLRDGAGGHRGLMGLVWLGGGVEGLGRAGSGERVVANVQGLGTRANMLSIDRLWGQNVAFSVEGVSGDRPGVVVKLGETSLRGDSRVPRMDAGPPGLTLGPLASDWTLASLMRVGGGGQVRVSEQVTTALLQFDGLSKTWRVLIEARAVDGQVRLEDRVRLWVGPLGSPSSVLTIGADGSTVDSRTGKELLGVRVVRGKDRWQATVTLPEESVEKDMTIRLSVERIDPVLGRSAWPRAMMPWQREPGRAAINLGAWRGMQ